MWHEIALLLGRALSAVSCLHPVTPTFDPIPNLCTIMVLVSPSFFFNMCVVGVVALPRFFFAFCCACVGAIFLNFFITRFFLFCFVFYFNSLLPSSFLLALFRFVCLCAVLCSARYRVLEVYHCAAGVAVACVGPYSVEVQDSGH